jgi:hypothetical protein
MIVHDQMILEDRLAVESVRTRSPLQFVTQVDLFCGAAEPCDLMSIRGINVQPFDRFLGDNVNRLLD